MRLPINIVDKFYLKTIKILKKCHLFAEIDAFGSDMACLRNEGIL